MQPTPATGAHLAGRRPALSRRALLYMAACFAAAVVLWLGLRFGSGSELFRGSLHVWRQQNSMEQPFADYTKGSLPGAASSPPSMNTDNFAAAAGNATTADFFAGLSDEEEEPPILDGASVRGSIGAAHMHGSATEDQHPPPTTWPKPCGPSKPNGKAMPVSDLINAAMANLAMGSLFVTLKNAKASGWDGPGKLAAGELRQFRDALPPSNGSILKAWPQRRSCAAVGNSGHLKLSSYGKQIDSHDLVVRLNQGPTRGYEKWVGKKATVRFINYSWLQNYADMLTSGSSARSAGGQGSRVLPGPRGRSLLQKVGSKITRLRESALAHGRSAVRQHSTDLKGLFARHRRSDPLQQSQPSRSVHEPPSTVGSSYVRSMGMEAPLEKDVVLVFRWQTGNTAKDALGLIRKIQLARSDVQVVIITARFRAIVHKVMALFNQRLRCAEAVPEGGNSPSSGLVAVFMLMQLCKSVHLYGYGASAAAGRKVPYHYFTNMRERTWSTKATVHSFNSEQKLLERLAAGGYVVVCNDLSSQGCSKS